VTLIVVAGMPTLIWVGSFTYTSRVGQQLMILAVVALPFAARSRD
jgi:hypothetical protein